MTPIPDAPGLDQVSVWTYPRHAIAHAIDRHAPLSIVGDRASTCTPVSRLETNHPTIYYIPPPDEAVGRQTTPMPPHEKVPRQPAMLPGDHDFPSA